jgi:hypothetical protein
MPEEVLDDEEVAEGALRRRDKEFARIPQSGTIYL